VVNPDDGPSSRMPSRVAMLGFGLAGLASVAGVIATGNFRWWITPVVVIVSLSMVAFGLWLRSTARAARPPRGMLYRRGRQDRFGNRTSWLMGPDPANGKWHHAPHTRVRVAAGSRLDVFAEASYGGALPGFPFGDNTGVRSCSVPA
jgi:hypothetical protein